MNIGLKPFKIDGVTIPTPSSYDFNIEDLSSEQTGRTLDGIMHKDVVAVKDYYTVMWKKLSEDDAALILNLVDGKTQLSFTYVDPRYQAGVVTRDFYVGKRSGKAMNLRNSENTWNDITMQFTRI